MNTGQEDQVRAWYIGSDRIQTIYECWTCECECECWTLRLGVVLPGTPPQGLRFFFSATGWLVHHHYQCHQFFEGHQCHQFHQCNVFNPISVINVFSQLMSSRKLSGLLVWLTKAHTKKITIIEIITIIKKVTNSPIISIIDFIKE